MGRSARRLATLLPALLCAVWSLLVLPAPAAQALAPTPHPVTAAFPAAPGAAHHAPGYSPPHSPARTSSPEPHFAPTAVVRLPAAVENPLRIPGTPAGTTAVPVDLSVPARGVLAGDPRRERAPPAGPRAPRAPRGPPSARHS
ncbi:hypothetical protein AB0M38_35045 [Streptomyces sp. NPDC051742]|uniref:hypothetical protein n=1 Tax=unclassified Streptomyces TaxID=2593676 RepID=UPI00343B6ADB